MWWHGVNTESFQIISFRLALNDVKSRDTTGSVRFLKAPPTHYFCFILLCSLTVCVIWPPHTEPGLCLQLALKQLSPGVRVEPCSSAVLQFSVEEIGQLVPLLPNPCTPISTTRWQTEDLDGNKVLFQVSSA